MDLKTSVEYKASCEIGLNPPLNILISTVRLGRFNAAAISEIVMPFIFIISVILSKNIIFVNIKPQFIEKNSILPYKCKDKITFYIDLL